jgi:hypothetical protein
MSHLPYNSKKLQLKLLMQLEELLKMVHPLQKLLELVMK